MRRFGNHEKVALRRIWYETEFDAVTDSTQ